MKVTIKHNGEEEIFQYSPEATIQEVREMALPKVQCKKATQLTVRKHTGSRRLTTGTFADLGIQETDVLVVDVRKDNPEVRAARNLITGVQHSTKKDVSHLLKQAKNNQEENIRHHEATHEHLDEIAKNINDNKNITKKEGESSSQYKKRLRTIRTEVNTRIEEEITYEQGKNESNQSSIRKP